MTKTRQLLSLLAVAASSVSLLAVQAGVAQDSPIDDLTPVTDEMLNNPPDGDWLMWRRTYNGWGYSPLDEINKDNVGDLELAWAWGMSPGGRSQETPLVHDGILYLQNSSHLIQALDGATGELIWEYEYELPDEVNPNGERSKAIYDDKLIIATRDAHLIALDAKTGQLIWDKTVANYEHGFAFSSGPIVANGVVVQGMTGCSNAQPGGCFFTGHDVDTGEELWRVHTIARGDTPEGNSWNGLPLESRYGASAWITGSYDPEQNLIFAGVGQPYPWNVEIAGLTPPSSDPNVTNEALYTNSTLAIDVTTGELEWYHQYLETDSLDLDYAYERILVDLPFNGEMRQQVVTTGKIGIIESLDRTTGEWLWAQETAPQNVVLSIDPDTGEKEINPEVIPVIGETTFNCPADPGSKAWQATAYSPRTETLYLPTVEFCSNTTVNPLDPGEIYTGGGLQTFARVPHPDGDGNIGQVRAINLVDQSEVWQYRQYAPVTSATLPTGGGLVFVGSLDRKFMAFDDETGEKLWESGPLSNSLESFPISYEAGGKQYVAVVANWASGLGRLASLTPDIRLPSDNPATLYVFALPD
ncbi:PQQ-binding-like beta-propeller repeat protein [Pelagibacterium flavum]|uniref:PQQ-binding-like beta-propeller repeat protein n=1 Tax=Pelagibacterium flavum TaxID=2984530 RepID=A0ABY6IJY5_9HYPH|nr:PQQ-binding-like beta-propeller repeat protein [Pelagibacterium sp. YIM 151497]UYQ70796.1 PQQ-binding-like beta-propeller repeat protein [Pelagibacterium sp. YIM 151497]